MGLAEDLGIVDDLELDMPLDEGIRDYVLILRSGGVETFESCEGGEGHAFPEPTVRFHGEPAAGYHALSVALAHGLPVSEIRRVWDVYNGELHGPVWEIVFDREGAK